jgi:hypothetical protein
MECRRARWQGSKLMVWVCKLLVHHAQRVDDLEYFGRV